MITDLLPARRRPARSSARPGHPLALLLLLSSLGLAGCGMERGEASDPEELAVVDAVLAELGGSATADLTRGQRWRMISSVGAGLPPFTYEPASLPEFGGRGATLAMTYCQRCHGLPAPQMHSAAEWPILIRRMVMRARTLDDHMGGPETKGMLGEILMAGMASAEVPSAEEIELMVAYFQANALPAADDPTLDDTPEGQLFVERCSICHDTPSPAAHTPADWGAVVQRMKGNAALMDVAGATEEEAARIVEWLAARAAL